MCGFITKSGTRYYIDTNNQMICGGQITNPVHYTSCTALLIGTRPSFQLITGQVLRTSEIVDYF